MKKIVIGFSSSLHDQKRLSEAGGTIGFKKGQPVFEFPSFKHYQHYQDLNQRRANA